MRKLIVIGILLAALSGCATRTDYGDCIGINDEANPALQYKYSVRNIVVGAVFVETIFVPVLVVLNQLKCPVGLK